MMCKTRKLRTVPARRELRRGWLVFALLGIALGLNQSVFAQLERRLSESRPLVAEVRVTGNDATETSFVLAQLRTRRDREFDPEVVQADVRRLASTGRFRDVRTYTQDVAGGVVVTFEVFERPTIRYVRYLGNKGISDKALFKQDGIEIGDPLNQFAIEEARRKVEEFYHSKGFAKTQVSIFEGDDPDDRGAVFVVNEGALERIAKVTFVGNTIASDARLETQIQSKPGIFFGYGFFRGKVERKKIDEDIQRLTAYYRNLGYFNARIGRELEFDDEGKWLTLRFVIDEGPRYVVRNVAFIGNSRFASTDLAERMELKSGEFFNLGKMQKDVNALRDIYGGHGHYFADIKADPRFLEQPGQLDVIYNIEEGGVWRVGKINVHIAGEHPHTRQSVVMNRLSIRPGDVIDIREVRASERRLKASQLFLNDPTKGEAPRVVIRPPELQDSVENIARGSSSGGTFRGQSPDDEPQQPPQTTPPPETTSPPTKRSSFFWPWSR